MVATHWVEMLTAKASAMGSVGIVLESSITASGTDGMTLALVSAVGSFVVA
jgi:hypothetical protein